MSDLYDTDIVLWSEEQAKRLRHVAAAERLNAGSPDWPNIIEEIESVGRSQIETAESLLLPAILHDLKVKIWPESRDVPHWEMEAGVFRAQASFRFVPSMRPRIDIQKIYGRAVRVLAKAVERDPGRPIPVECPFSLDDYLANEG